MGFLKKVGFVLLKFTEVFVGLAPIFGKTVPGTTIPVSVVSQDLAQIAQIVVTAEAFGQALSIPGPDKLKGATPLIAQIILQSSLLVDRKIADPVKFQAACAGLGSSMADLLNSLKDDVDSENKA